MLGIVDAPRIGNRMLGILSFILEHIANAVCRAHKHELRLTECFAKNRPKLLMAMVNVLVQSAMFVELKLVEIKCRPN